MRNVLLLMLAAVLQLGATTVLSPALEIVAKGVVKDMVLRDKELLFGTDQGVLQVYDYEAQVFSYEIALAPVKDFVGDTIPPRIFSIDKMQGRYVLLSDSGKGGYVNLWIHENNVTTQLLNHTNKIAAVKIRFIDKNKVLLGLLSNEAVLFDVVSKKEIFRVQLSPSKFSDFALNEDRTQAVFACESGVLTVIDTSTGKVLKELKGLNVDNVYKVDFKQGIVSAAGQDRRAALYDVNTGKGKYKEGHFLIYATGLSPSTKRVAFAMDEYNNITIYNRSTMSKMALLKGQKSTLNTIIFKDENVLFSSSDNDSVMMWNLKL